MRVGTETQKQTRLKPKAATEFQCFHISCENISKFNTTSKKLSFIFQQLCNLNSTRTHGVQSKQRPRRFSFPCATNRPTHNAQVLWVCFGIGLQIFVICNYVPTTAFIPAARETSLTSRSGHFMAFQSNHSKHTPKCRRINR